MNKLVLFLWGTGGGATRVSPFARPQRRIVGTATCSAKYCMMQAIATRTNTSSWETIHGKKTCSFTSLGTAALPGMRVPVV